MTKRKSDPASSEKKPAPDVNLAVKVGETLQTSRVYVRRCQGCGWFLCGIKLDQFTTGSKTLLQIATRCPNRRCRKKDLFSYSVEGLIK